MKFETRTITLALNCDRQVINIPQVTNINKYKDSISIDPKDNGSNSLWDKWSLCISKISSDTNKQFKEILSLLKDQNEGCLIDRLTQAFELVESYDESANKSLIHLLRYWPELKLKPEIYFYISGIYWGIIYKQTAKGKGTLNFYVKDSGEIIYSYARKGFKGVNRFTGKSYISNDLKDSKDIKTIFNMIW